MKKVEEKKWGLASIEKVSNSFRSKKDGLFTTHERRGHGGGNINFIFYIKTNLLTSHSLVLPFPCESAVLPAWTATREK